MLKNNMLESLQEVQEILEGCNFKKLTDNQKEVLNGNYNTSINFEYCGYEDSEADGYILLMSESNFKKFEYFLGMEYEKDNIEIKVVLNGNVLIIYSDDSNRAKELFNLLKENEEE